MQTCTGYADSSPQAETFSMHGPVYQQLQTGGLQKLMELGKQIILERDKAMPSFSCVFLCSSVCSRSVDH
jgi:hypothetical protein